MQTYSQIRGSILAAEYEPVSAFSCQQGHTSDTAADLPTKGQVSEAAWAASQASAGRLAALTSQVTPRSPSGPFFPDPTLPASWLPTPFSCWPLHSAELACMREVHG